MSNITPKTFLNTRNMFEHLEAPRAYSVLWRRVLEALGVAAAPPPPFSSLLLLQCHASDIPNWGAELN